MRFNDFREVMCPNLNCWRMHRALWLDNHKVARFYTHDRTATWSRVHVAALPCGHYIEADYPFRIYDHR